jgi:hypothetical protein
MHDVKVQAKFKIDSATVAAFKAACAAEGVSMSSVVCQWMKSGKPTKPTKMKFDTRPHRKKAVAEIIGQLEVLLQNEERYRDAIPEQFASRRDASDQACEQLAQAIECLECAF